MINAKWRNKRGDIEWWQKDINSEVMNNDDGKLSHMMSMVMMLI